MIDDIVFTFSTFILELNPIVSGQVTGFSLDGSDYAFTEVGNIEVYF